MLQLAEVITPQVQAAPAVHLRLVSMSKATYIGELYETPTQRHPQEEPLAEMYRVEEAGTDSGVYAIPVVGGGDTVSLFLSQAKKVTSPLPKREGLLPTYGLNEVTLYPVADKDVLDLTQLPDVSRALCREIKERHKIFAPTIR